MHETLKWMYYDMLSWSKNNTETYFVKNVWELEGIKKNVEELKLTDVVTIVGHDVILHREIFRRIKA